MNRFKNKDHESLLEKLSNNREMDFYFDLIGLDGFYGEPTKFQYQDLYDMLADDYRCGYHGDRKTKLLLYIAHRAYREHEYVIHTGTGFSRFDAPDHGDSDPAVIEELCEDYDCYEKEEVREFLAGIR